MCAAHNLSLWSGFSNTGKIDQGMWHHFRMVVAQSTKSLHSTVPFSLQARPLGGATSEVAPGGKFRERHHQGMDSSLEEESSPAKQDEPERMEECEGKEGLGGKERKKTGSLVEMMGT